MVDEKEKVEKELKEKEEKKEKEWWKNIPTWILVAVVFVFFLALRGVTMEGAGTSQVIILGIVIALFIMLSKKERLIGIILSPREAEIYVERDCYRKQAWGQFPIMSKFKIGPVNNAQRRDGGGMYYDVGVTEINPYDKPKYYVAKIPMKGDEKSYVSFVDLVSPFTGREKTAERTLWGITRKLRDDPLFGKFFTR